MELKSIPFSAQDARDAFNYDPDTGILTWKIAPGKRGADFIGRQVGTVNSAGYRHMKFMKHNTYVHRVVWLWMTGVWPGLFEIDHVNGRRADNRWQNLRLATHQQNLKNQGKRINNTSGAKCVQKRVNRSGRVVWWSSVQIEGRKRKNLGTFATMEEASTAYREAATRIHGEFAKL